MTPNVVPAPSTKVSAVLMPSREGRSPLRIAAYVRYTPITTTLLRIGATAGTRKRRWA
jgi:hypothetical protein